LYQECQEVDGKERLDACRVFQKHRGDLVNGIELLVSAVRFFDGPVVTMDDGQGT
jgi:hypothetical protein